LIEFLKKSSDDKKKMLKGMNKGPEESPINSFFKSMTLTVKDFSSGFKIKLKISITYYYNRIINRK